MNVQVNYEIEDGNTLDETTTRNRSVLEEKGFDGEDQTKLKDSIADAIVKEKAQNKAEKDAEDKTAEQDAVMDKSQKLVKKVRGAALTGFASDQRVLDLFNVHKRLPYSVNGLRSELELYSTLIPGREIVLLKSGLMQVDITAVSSLPTELVNVDKAQGDAAKIRNSATIIRDEAIKVLKAIKKKIRNFVKTAFPNNAEILVQFEPLPKPRGGNNTKPPENPPTPPAQ